MHDVYAFVTGPLVWVSFIIFVGGESVSIHIHGHVGKEEGSHGVRLLEPLLCISLHYSLDRPFCQYELENETVFHHCNLCLSSLPSHRPYIFIRTRNFVEAGVGYQLVVHIGWDG
jgi:hypothetical protein